MQETESSCAKFTLAGVVVRASFPNEGKKVPIAVLRGALEQLQEQHLAWAVIFTDEKMDPPTRVGRRELRTLLLWRLEYVLQQRVHVTVMPGDLVGWERDFKLTKSRTGWVDSPAGLIEAVNDLAVYAAEVAKQKARALEEDEEEEEEDVDDSGSDWAEYEESDSAGSDMEIDTHAFGAGKRKSRHEGFAFRSTKSAKKARLLQATALPTVNELMKSHTLIKKLLGRKLMVIKNGEPLLAVGTSTRVLHGRPEMFMNTPSGGEWMDGVTALTNIMALEVAERHPLLNNTAGRLQQEMPDYEGDRPRSWAAAWRAGSVLGPLLEAAREVFELRNLCAVGEALHQQAVSTVRVRLAVPGCIGLLLGEQKACWVLLLRQRVRSSSCATSVQ